MTLKKLSIAVILTFILTIAYQVLAVYMISPEGLQYPNPGHYPGEIGPGTFNASGNPNAFWKFPGNINLTGDIGMQSVVIKGDGSVSPGLNAEKLQGYTPSDLMAANGYPGMELQGNLVLRDNANNYGISTIPLSLPKVNCNIKITVCDYGNNPPTKLIVGADPVPRITKNRNDLDDYSTYISSDNDQDCGKTISCGYNSDVCKGCPSGYTRFFGSYSCGTYCFLPCTFKRNYCVCCPETLPGKTNQVAFYDGDSCECVYCPDLYPYWDSEDDVCYREPRCPSPDAGEVFIQEDDVDNVCVYCPADHPIYDATTKHCIKEASTNATKVGNCATLSAVLESAFTDVTFADADNNPLSTADYVAVAYSCPE